VRVPLAPEGNAAGNMASVVELVERFEAFYPDILPVTGMLNYRYQCPVHFFLRVRGGPSLWLVTSKDDPETSQDDIELFTVYHAQVGYEYRAFSLSGGVTGRMLVTTDADFDARSFHQLGFAANTQVGCS
jgi:hypothetical protein